MTDHGLTVEIIWQSALEIWAGIDQHVNSLTVKLELGTVEQTRI
jgi:hypothetical protein